MSFLAALTARSDTFLRRVLQCDALSCAGMAALFLGFSSQVESLLGIPKALQQEAALILVASTLFMLWTASRAALAPWAVGLVIAGNLLWVVGSIGVLLVGAVPAATLGGGFVIAQGVFVLALADLEYIGLKRLKAA